VGNDKRAERPSRDGTAAGEGKALKGEPQEREGHETRPRDPGRSKPSRGCENLEAELSGRGKPGHGGLPGGSAEGDGTPGEA
jgi:hypothetical protein